MVLKLYGHTVSTNTHRVQVVLNELNLNYELVSVHPFTETKTSEYTSIQPLGKVPCLDDDGFKLYEARAIARYLALKYGGIGTLIPDPADLQKTALFEQAVSLETTEFEPHALGLAIELVYRPGLLGGEAAVERLKIALDRTVAAYDVILSKTKYLAGDEISLVDLFHLPYPTALEKVGFDFLGNDRYPNVSRWWKDISSRPSWKHL